MLVATFGHDRALRAEAAALHPLYRWQPNLHPAGEAGFGGGNPRAALYRGQTGTVNSIEPRVRRDTFDSFRN